MGEKNKFGYEIQHIYLQWWVGKQQGLTRSILHYHLHYWLHAHANFEELNFYGLVL